MQQKVAEKPNMKHSIAPIYKPKIVTTRYYNNFAFNSNGSFNNLPCYPPESHQHDGANITSS